MTAAYSPRLEWVLDDRREARALTAVTPVLGPLVDGDLCDIVVSPFGARRRYCHTDAVRLVTDADGRERCLCSEHAALYFPGVTAAVSVAA
jgi:hypothetical protein